MKKIFQIPAVILLLVLPLISAVRPQNVTGEITILYTNDFHSAFDPIPAYWLPGSPKLGGAAYLTGLINQIRARDKTTFLFDTGDMFTGMFSFLTRGEALMEMMMSMRYDAMAIGNHEFDYGAANFEKQMYRVPFPVLGANIFYKGTKHRFSRPYTILEKNGIRLGVIGIIGQDARSVALPSGITNLDFEDPIPVVAELVKELKPQVDLIVVLAHQGKTGPMQTDAEARSEVQRDFAEDIRLCGAVPGIDVFVGGHAHRGIEKPYVHPETGTLIVQTYGYGTRLGYLKLKLRDGRIASHEGELLKVWTDRIEPDLEVAAKIEKYRKIVAPEIGGVVGNNTGRLVRDYNRESTLGSFVADVIRIRGNAEVGLTNAGGLRHDLPQGDVTRGNVLDALPFVNSLVVVEMTGKQLREVIEQGLTLERGLIQVSGMTGTYDLRRPPGSRLVDLRIGGKTVDPDRTYRVGTNSFIAEGGDLYRTFLECRRISTGALLSDVIMDFYREKGKIDPPAMNRLVPADGGGR